MLRLSGRYSSWNIQNILLHKITDSVNSITYIIKKQTTYTENKLPEQLFSRMNSGFPVPRFSSAIEGEGMDGW